MFIVGLTKRRVRVGYFVAVTVEHAICYRTSAYMLSLGGVASRSIEFKVSFII